LEAVSWRPHIIISCEQDSSAGADDVELQRKRSKVEASRSIICELAREESGLWFVQGKKEEREEARGFRNGRHTRWRWTLVGLACHNYRVSFFDRRPTLHLDAREPGKLCLACPFCLSIRTAKDRPCYVMSCRLPRSHRRSSDALPSSHHLHIRPYTHYYQSRPHRLLFLSSLSIFST
jgi:hypothetical protein